MKDTAQEQELDSPDLDIGRLAVRAAEFQSELESIKNLLEPADDFWYRYQSLTAFAHLDLLLTGEHRDLSKLIRGGPIADIGAADGDMSFFLETFGVRSDIIDYPLTNQNGLRGARKLRDHLGSSVQIHERDLDSQFTLPRDHYGLTLFLGILYHLKNPFFVLERLARHSAYCLLSTRIARYSVDHEIHFGDLPIAYLLAPEECNNDATNFWIFSPSGIARILDRSGWKILDTLHRGNEVRSDPATAEGDERAFFLLESRHLIS